MNSNLYIIKKLPVYTNEDNADREFISVNKNEKGELAKISVNSQINYIAYLDYKTGNCIRGNHYHLIKNESLYLCKGKIKGFFKSINDDIISEELIEEGTLIQISPGCIHAFEPVEDGYAIEFSPDPFDEECNDIYFFSIKQ